MSIFLNKQSQGKYMEDLVFKAALKAKAAKDVHGKSAVVDATLGTLYDDNGQLVTLESVYQAFDQLSNTSKAKYASSIQGNEDFRKHVTNWVLKDAANILNTDVIATPGGAGAVSSIIKNFTEPGHPVLFPHIGWGPYKTMASEHGCIYQSYELFDEKNNFNLEDIKARLSQNIAEFGKAMIVVNDPCHNPTGYTMSEDEWDQLITILNEESIHGNIVLVHDIAYMDYNQKGSHWNNHFKTLTRLSDSVLYVIAFSISKSLTAYGMRTGAAIFIHKNKKELEEIIQALVFSARNNWATVNNSGMDVFSKLMSDGSLKQRYIAEKSNYIDLINQRAMALIKELDAYDIPYYPYKEGFFVTLKVKNHKERDQIHKRLEESLIYTVLVNEGIRFAVCSVPESQMNGLGERIKKAYQ